MSVQISHKKGSEGRIAVATSTISQDRASLRLMKETLAEKLSATVNTTNEGIEVRHNDVQGVINLDDLTKWIGTLDNSLGIE